MVLFSLIPGKPFFLVYENDVDAFIPELWASEALLVLQENMIAGSLVYRDFENTLARYGDVVNTRRPADFRAKRKTNADNVVVQDAIATNVQVKLDQHVHTSFLIRDGEESKSFRDLVDEFLRPAIVAQARFIDQIVLGQYPRFLGNVVGGAGVFTATNAKAGLLASRQALNIAKMPMQGRNIIFNPITESILLNLDLFIQAQQVGDQGQALREATLGRKLGFDMWMDQNMPVVNAGNTVAGDTTAAAYTAGTTTIVVVTGTAGNFPVGGWLTIAGDMTPQQIVSFNSGTKTAVITPGLKTNTASGAAVSTYTGGAVNNSAGYPAGYAKEITVDAFTVALQVGQMVVFAGDTTRYSVIDVNGLVGITLDRPLKNAIVNDQVVLPGPAGAFNLAFHRNAIALVVRPLAQPRQGTGALSSVVNYNDLSMRATITYDGNKQGHLVTLDMLCGIEVLDPNLGGVIVS